MGTIGQAWFDDGKWLTSPTLLVVLALWSAVWTGFALWYAARRGEKHWFILFLLVHTAGIGEFLYLVFVVKLFRQKKFKH